MAQIRPLAHAPIVEALIDLRVHAPNGTTVEQLEKAIEGQDFGYHKKGPIIRSSLGFSFNLEEPHQPTSETAIVGIRLHSADERYVAQFTIEGFTLSRLEPYESWDILITEAKRIWAIYQACTKPTRIYRTATRYINNLRLPMKEGERFENFLTGLPVMPPDFPQTISSFLQRFVVYDIQCGATAVLTQALEQFTAETALPVILDIDVFKETNFSPVGPEVWNYLAELRNLKNKFFFGALTEKALELYA